MTEAGGGRGRPRRWWAPGPAPLVAAAIDELDWVLGRVAEAFSAEGETEASRVPPRVPGLESTALLRSLLHAHLASRPERDLAFALGLLWAIGSLERLRSEICELIAEGRSSGSVAPGQGPSQAGHLVAEIPPLLDLLRRAFRDDDAPAARRVEETARTARREAAALAPALAESGRGASSVVHEVLRAASLCEVFTAIGSVATVQGCPYGEPPRRPPARPRYEPDGSGIVHRR